MPAALVESYFITNKKEYYSLTHNSENLITSEAQGISQGIINYFADPDNNSFSEENSGSLYINRVDE